MPLFFTFKTIKMLIAYIKILGKALHTRYRILTEHTAWLFLHQTSSKELKTWLSKFEFSIIYYFQDIAI